MTDSASSLRRRTKIALLWSGFGTYGASLLRLIALLALGWMLPPSDFGLLALAMILVGLAEALGDLGLTAALIQQKEVDRRTLDSAFWSSLAIHLLLAAATVIWARPITSLFGDSGAAPLLRLLSLVFPISGLGVVPRALLMKEMSFRRVSTAQVAGVLAFAVVGLTMAALGFGAWSLGGAVLMQRVLHSAFIWHAVRWRPRLLIDPAALGRLVRFGGPFVTSALIGRALNIDYFVIGRFIGTVPLGYYSLASQLAMVPLDRLVGLTSRVAFPAFSEVQDDPKRLKSGLLDGLRHLFTLLVPVVIHIVVLGPWLLRGIYAEKWETSIVPLQILGLSGLFLVQRLVESAFLAIGRSHLRLWLVLLRLCVFAVLVSTIGLDYGIGGVAASVAGSFLVWAAATLVVGGRILDLGVRDIGAALWPATRAGLAALTPLGLFLFVPGLQASPWVALAYSGVTVSAVYLSLVLPTYRQALRGRWLS